MTGSTRRYAFYSFHYANDSWRASQVRNMGVVDGNKPANDNDWEKVKQGGDAAIKRWIDNQMDGKSVVVVLIGAQTAKRTWIEHEIKKGWEDGKGLLGVRIHRLENQDGKTDTKGDNPFSNIVVSARKRTTSGPLPSESIRLSTIVPVYDPSGASGAYGDIKANLSKWIEEAILIRKQYV